ncbi:MAG: alpha/beta hydrolase [Pseudomonadota bacterium]|nr:alpha/beta hydrolase [Pseudomonadota bacterium]
MHTGARLHVVEQGEGPCVILVHGWCCHGGFWEPQLRHLATRYRVITPDLAGHGHSPAVRDSWTIATFRDDLLAVIGEAGVEAVTLAGHSLGALVALEAAAQLGERVNGVLLLEAFPYDYGYLKAKHVRELLAPFQRNFAGALRKMVRNITADGTPAGIVEEIAEAMARTPAGLGLQAFESLLRWDPAPAFGRTLAPVHCLVGSRYDRRARTRYAGFVREWPLGDAGHFPMLEDPERFNRLLDEVLDKMAGARSGA